MKMVYNDYTLSSSAVDAISSDVQSYLGRHKVKQSNLQRIRLTVEELLLNLLEHFGEGFMISVGIGKQFGRQVLRIRYTAEPYDPTKSGENPLTEDMLRSLGLFPAWSCRGKSNTVSLVLAERPKRSTLFYIALAALSAVILGALGGFIPEDVRLAAVSSILSPAASSFLGLLSTFAGVMIFLTICSGILDMGDTATLGRMGKSVVIRFIVISFVISAAAAVAVLPFMRLNFSSGAQTQSSALAEIVKMIFDILPTNIIDPFRTGNTFHIIVIAVFIGCALLAIGERGSRIRGLVGECAVLFQHIVSAVCALVPLFVFSMLLQLIWSGQAAVLLTVLKPIILIVVLVAVLTLAIWITSAVILKCPPLLLMKKVLPPSLIAFTTASSVSAFQLATETCEKKLGVKSSLTSFVYPLGSVIYMPSSVVYFTVLVLTFAETYNIAVSAQWIIMAAVISTLITIAMPPIPGGDILCYTVLFSSLGIPAEAIMLATAIGIVIDYIDTGANVMLLIFQIACEAKRLDCLDESVLSEN